MATSQLELEQRKTILLARLSKAHQTIKTTRRSSLPELAQAFHQSSMRLNVSTLLSSLTPISKLNLSLAFSTLKQNKSTSIQKSTLLPPSKNNDTKTNETNATNETNE